MTQALAASMAYERRGVARGDGVARVDVVVHTNNIGLANATFGPDWEAQPAALHVSGPETPLLQMLHELIFCCHTLVVGVSALSSVAALATEAQAVYGRVPHDMHFGFTYRVVPR